MEPTDYNLARKSNALLLAELHALIRRGHEHEAELLGYLAEVDERRLYAEQAASSMFVWCMQRLGFSEDVAYKRLQACRAARRFPVILALVAQGELHLTAVNLLAPHLTEGNHAELCEAARRKSKREVESLLATRFPKPDAPTLLRKVPLKPAALAFAGASAPDSPEPSPLASASEAVAGGTVTPSQRPDEGTRPSVRAQAPARASVAPLAADRYKLQVTLGEVTREKLLRAQQLLRHKVPNGDLAAVLDLALTQLCASLENQKFATLRRPKAATGVATNLGPRDACADAAPSPSPPERATPSSPAPAQVASAESAATATDVAATGAVPRGARTRSRYIPRAIRRAVAERDGRQCTFVASDGRRCSAVAQLEFHHIEPFARRGATSVANVTLRCRCHNRHAAEQAFGKEFVQAAIRSQGRAAKTRLL